MNSIPDHVLQINVAPFFCEENLDQHKSQSAARIVKNNYVGIYLNSTMARLLWRALAMQGQQGQAK